MKSSSGQPVKLLRPPDLLVVADHSGGMGFFPMVITGGPQVLADPRGRKAMTLQEPAATSPICYTPGGCRP